MSSSVYHIADRASSGNAHMNRQRMIGPMENRLTVSNRPRKRPARLEGKRPRPRCRLQLEQLENRVTPSVLSVCELDGNVTTGVLGTSGSTTTSHDWDQVFADSQAVPPTSTSGAV